MRNKKIYIYIPLMILLSFKSFSQVIKHELTFMHITNDQGLSNSTIETIFQDSRGFIWFGTRDGLNKYDGAQMTVYKYNVKDSTSISDNYIQYMYEDHYQNLWIGTRNGLNKFNPLTNDFRRYKHIPENKTTISGNHITCIYQDKKNRLLVSVLGKGISFYNYNDNTFSHFSEENSTGNAFNTNINYIFEDSFNNCWLATNNGLQLFNRETKSVKTIDIFNASKNTNKSYSIYVIKESKPGILLLGTTDNGIIVFNTQQRTFKYYYHKDKDSLSLPSNLVRSILVTKAGNIWIGCVNGGLNLFDINTGNFYNYQNHPEDPQSLSQRTVSALFEDNQKNLWIGTHRGGINLYTPDTEKFALYRQKRDINSLSYNDVKTFCEDKAGNIWVGTDGGGLNLYDRKKNNFSHYTFSPYNQNSIGSNEVLDVMEDSEGNLWISTWGGGLNLLNKKTGDFTRFINNPLDKTSISANYVQKVFEDKNKNIWVATYFGGLNLFNRKTKKFSRIINDINNNTKLLGNNIITLNEDYENNLWIGTDDAGLSCLNATTKKFTNYFNDEEKKPDLRVIFIDSKGRLWIGQNGLYLFNKHKLTFSLYTDKAGLASEFIKGIIEDASGNFWISTSNGITQFNPDNFVYKKYNTADGLQGLEYEANACLKTKDGQIYFGGVNGFNVFYPQSITVNSFLPPVYITDFQIFNRKVNIKERDAPLLSDITAANSIKLSYKQSTFSFGFAALNYTASQNNQYAYKLQGWDKDWIYTEKEKKASYTNVSPGEYTFMVKASNNDGVWNNKITSIKICIVPPFWATWWFILLLFSTLVAIAVWFFNFKRKLELQKLEEKKREEMHQVQLQFFTNISHEFRTPLSLILGPLEKLQKEAPQSLSNHYYKIIHRNANRLMGLINELMDFRKVESGILKLNVMPGNMHSFIQQISEEFNELALEKNIHFSILFNCGQAETWFDRQVLEKIVINLISNAFKYTDNNSHITIEVFDNIEKFSPSFENELTIKHHYKAKQYIFIRVADTGIGISKTSIPHLFERYYKISDTHLGSGIGLAFVKSLTALHKGSIYVYSERNKGTEIIVAVPCSKDDYLKDEKWLKNKEISLKLESIPSSYNNAIPFFENAIGEAEEEINTESKLTILIVDDNNELRTFLSESLLPFYKIIEATDGALGYEKAKEIFPDLIISDVMMPGVNGNEFCKKVKQDIDTSHIPFLMLTAKDALESKIEGVESGADFYFSKPLSIELLLLTLRNIFAQKLKLKDKYVKDNHADIKELANSTMDKAFLEKLIQIVELQLSNTDMDIPYICTEMNMSRTKLYNKVKGLTGQSIIDFIRTIRLKKASQLMVEGSMSITDVMYSVGIQTQSYFTKAFKNEFGKTPTQFLRELEK